MERDMEKEKDIIDILEKNIGEYIEGKKNGKGKEYYLENNGKVGYLIFEGEFYYNYEFKGKEYFKSGQLKFEGEYLFQEKWDGKFYDYNGNVIFELKEGNAKVEEEFSKIKIYMGENLNEKNIRGKLKLKNMIILVIYYLKEII